MMHIGFSPNLMYENINNLFSICVQLVQSKAAWASDIAFYQLWEAVRIRIQIQMLLSK